MHSYIIQKLRFGVGFTKVNLNLTQGSKLPRGPVAIGHQIF